MTKNVFQRRSDNYNIVNNGISGQKKKKSSRSMYIATWHTNLSSSASDQSTVLADGKVQNHAQRDRRRINGFES